MFLNSQAAIKYLGIASPFCSISLRTSGKYKDAEIGSRFADLLLLPSCGRRLLAEQAARRRKASMLEETVLRLHKLLQMFGREEKVTSVIRQALLADRIHRQVAAEIEIESDQTSDRVLKFESGKLAHDGLTWIVIAAQIHGIQLAVDPACHLLSLRERGLRNRRGRHRKSVDLLAHEFPLAMAHDL